MMEVVSGDYWSYKTCKAAVKTIRPKNQHPILFTGQRPSLSTISSFTFRLTSRDYSSFKLVSLWSSKEESLAIASACLFTGRQ